MATTTESHKSSPTPPPPAKSFVSADTTISRIVDDISGLTLLQAADLVAQLKVGQTVAAFFKPYQYFCIVDTAEYPRNRHAISSRTSTNY